MAINTFDSIPEDITAKALANNFSIEEKSRREAALVNKEFYYGNTREHLEMFNLDVEPLCVNLTRPIVQKRATLLYNQKLVRNIVGPAGSISILEQVYTDNDIDNLMLNIDLLAELTGSVLVMPILNEEMSGKVKLILWDGASVSVVPDEEDTNLPAAISLVKLVDKLMKGWEEGAPQNERVLQQQIWTKDKVVLYQGPELRVSESNDLGFLPFVNFQGEEIYGQYIGYAPGSIVRKLNASINQKLTDLSYTIKLQAATPIAITGYQSGEDIVLSPGRALSLPVGATAEVLKLEPEIEETLATIQYLEDKIYDTSSVPKISVMGGEGNSGRELLVRWFPLTQVFREKSVRFEKYELELANMILAVLGEQPIESIKINYPDEDNLPFSPREDGIDRELKFGITSPSDELMKINTDLTLDEAKAEIKENLDETREFQIDVIKEDSRAED